MGLTLSKSSMVSFIARKAINDTGGRKFNPGAALQVQNDSEGNFLSAIWNAGRQLVGFLVRVTAALTGFVFSFAGLVGQIVNAVRFVWSYNLNTPDSQIDNQIRGLWQSFIPRVGGALGQALGWFVCGAIPGAVLFKFNKALGIKVLTDVGEEAYDEMMATLRNMGSAMVSATLKTFFLKAFKSIRKWLKRPGNPLYQFLPQGLRDAWQGNRPWSFAKAVEAKVETLDPNWESFTEEALEEFGDSCTEALFLVANSVDVWMAEQRTKATSPLGDDYVVEVYPNRDETESFVMAGPLEILKEAIPTEIQKRHYLADKDLGIVFNADKQDEFIKAEPESLYGYITYRFEDKTEVTRPSVKISDLRRNKLSFADIRGAADANGYLYGSFQGVARLDNGRRIKVFAASAELAEARVQALAVLTSAEIVTIDVTQERNGFARVTRDYLKRPVKKILPYRFVLINRKYFTEPIQGAQPSKRGNYLERKWIFDISTAEKPFDWDERIAEILIGPTVANP